MPKSHQTRTGDKQLIVAPSSAESSPDTVGVERPSCLIQILSHVMWQYDGLKLYILLGALLPAWCKDILGNAGVKVLECRARSGSSIGRPVRSLISLFI